MAILQSTADDAGAPGRDDEFGFGRINAGAAVLMAAAPVVLSASRPEVQFLKSNTSSVSTVQILNATSSLPINNLQFQVLGAPWLSGLLAGTSTPTSLEINLNRTGLAIGGTHAGAIRVASGPNHVDVRVIVEVPIPAPTQPILVLLLDTQGQLVTSTTGDANGNFRLGGIPAGTYTFRAGIDTNQNGTFTDPGDWQVAPATAQLDGAGVLNAGTLVAPYHRAR
jgi:hypothetical protein